MRMRTSVISLFALAALVVDASAWQRPVLLHVHSRHSSEHSHSRLLALRGGNSCQSSTHHSSCSLLLTIRGGGINKPKDSSPPPQEPTLNTLVVARILGFAILPTLLRLAYALLLRPSAAPLSEPTLLQTLFSTSPAVPVAAKAPLPFPARWQVALAMAWAASNIAVLVPGRYDGRAAMKSERPAASTANLFTPSGYAFIIWAPIFLGEWLMMLYLTNVPSAAALGRAVAPGWVAGTIAQTLWCGAFRPSVCGPSLLWVPTLLLGTTGVLLGVAHRALRAFSDSSPSAVGALGSLLVRWPLTLHFGWISCAALVNLNNFLARTEVSTPLKELASHGSVAAAVGAAAYVSVTTGDPIFSGVVAWALVAIAVDGSKAARGLVADEVLNRTQLSARLGAAVTALLVVLCAAGIVRPQA